MAPRKRGRGAARALRPWIIAALVSAALALFWFTRSPATQVDLRPIANQNVLLVTIDTLRADALGCYGGAAATPALDRLAAEGVRFEFAHAHAVLTLPSHTSILTGQYPFQHGVRDNSGYRVAPNARTIATRLKAAGYRTGAFVAAFPVHSRFGLNVGFDVYDDRFGETRAPTDFVMPERPGTTVVALAREWIATNPHPPSTTNPQSPTPNPWFTWVHLFEPHAPYRPPPPFDAQYANKPYDGEVAAADAALAPLLNDVRASGRPTLVVVTGDHGEALGDHGEETHGLFAYESTLRIPLVIAELNAGPARGGEVSSTPARHVDILPTILDAAGQPPPADLPGRSLLPAAERRSTAPRTSYFEAMSAMLNRGWAPLSGVVSDRDKYIDVPLPERYDLRADAAETSNLWGNSAERDRALAAVLRSFGAAPPGERAREDPQTASQLRALGYVTGSAPIKAKYGENDDPKRLVALDQAIHRGVAFYIEKRFGDAVREYERVIAERPDMTIAYRHLAFVYWEAGDVAHAIDTLRRAVAAGVTRADVTTQLGTYLAESGRGAEAIRLLEPVAAAAAGGTPDVDTLNALGIAYARAGRAEDARLIFDQILMLDPESVLAHENLGALDLAAARNEAAERHFETAVRLDPDASQAHAGLGVVAMRRGDREAAIAAWTKAVRLDATNYDALYNLATTLARAGRMEAARPYLEQFVRTAPPAFYARDIEAVRRVLQQRP